MVKFRLIPTIILNGHMIVQSFQFKKFLPIGNVETAIEFFNNWDVDEIVLLDIMATKEQRTPNIKIVEKAAKGCFVPMSFGGGIKTLEDIRNIIRAGADKVIIGAEAVINPDLISAGARRFGDQCISVSIDYKKNVDGVNEVYIQNGSIPTSMDPTTWARKLESLGAGEILLYSIDRDGTRTGYDLKTIADVANSVKIPVVACGGGGKLSHLVEGILKGNAQAVAAGNIFHHTEHSTIQAKAFLKDNGLNIRLSSTANYDGFKFDQFERAF
jgi:imidazole glycerol-phosphate synthase subunit HisF